MSDLLIEFLSEEIPARMQAKAAEDLKRLVTDGLVEAGLTYRDAAAFDLAATLATATIGIAAILELMFRKSWIGRRATGSSNTPSTSRSSRRCWRGRWCAGA